MRDKFLFFKNFKTVADKLPDDLRLKFYDAMTAYVFDGVEPDDPIVGALVGAIKPSLDKVENRGGFREGAGRPKSNEIKKNQNNQSFQETRNEKEEIYKKKNAKKKKESNAVQSDSYEGGTPL